MVWNEPLERQEQKERELKMAEVKDCDIEVAKKFREEDYKFTSTVSYLAQYRESIERPLKDLTKERDELTEKCGRLAAEVNELKTWNDSQRVNIEAIQRRRDEHQKQLHDLQEAYSKLEAERNELNAKCRQQDEVIDFMRNEELNGTHKRVYYPSVGKVSITLPMVVKN